MGRHPWRINFKTTLDSYIDAKRQQDPGYAPSPALGWTQRNMGWMQVLLVFGLGIAGYFLGWHR